MSFELVGVRLVAEDAPRYMSTLAQADKATLGFGDSSARTFKQMPGLADIAAGALHKVGTIAVDVFMQAGRAAVGFFSDSISAAGDFESGMNKFAAVAGGALEESGLALKDFRDQFLQIGKELPVSTSEVQEAAIEMVKGGIEPATIAAGGLKQVIQFAAAADLDLAEASTIAAKALGGWTAITATAQEKAEFLAHSTDLLARAANASTVNVDDLALGLYNVQGTAKLAGVSFDETVTTLAQLAPSFASSADAGTSFKSFLGSLQPKTKPAIAAMQALNLVTEDGKSVFYDAQGNFIGMAKASGILHDATKDLTEAQRIQMLTQIFGQDGIRVAAVLAEQGADGYNAMTAALEKQNSVAEMAKQKQAGFNTAMDNFKGSVEALQITIGSYLLPVLTDLFNNYLAPGINTITAFAESIFAADDPILALTTAIDGVLPGFQGFADFMGVAIPEAVNFLMEHLDAVKGALVAIGVVIAGAAVAGAIASLLNPITLVIGAVALLGAAWAEDWGGIQTTLTDFWTTTGQPIFEEVTTWLGDNIPKAIAVVSDYWTTTLLPALQKVWSFLQANVLPILKTLVETYFKMVETELRVLADFWTTILWPALKDVWGFLDKFVIPLLTALANVYIAMVVRQVKDMADVWTNILLPAITDVYDWFNDNIIPIFTDIGTEATGLTKTIRDTVGPAFTWLGEHVIQPVVGFFDDLIGKIQGVIDFLNDLADKINNLPSIPGVGGGESFLGGGGGRASGIASPNTLMGRGIGSSATYNQQRTANITYHTQIAPPPAQSYALANALAGGS